MERLAPALAGQPLALLALQGVPPGMCLSVPELLVRQQGLGLERWLRLALLLLALVASLLAGFDRFEGHWLVLLG